MLTLDKVYHAQYVLKNVARRTDVIEAPNLNPSAHVMLKTENLQNTGSFKVRGAAYKISTLTDEEKEHGVIACSAGNHAQGVALAAQKNGIKAVICLPEGAPISKVEATRRYGAEIVLVPGVYDDAYKKALELRDQYNYTFIHPFNDELVIAGQGTIALELVEQVPKMDAVVVPVGGGGLISGIAFTLKQLNPKIKVYGVQAQGAAGMLNSIQKNHVEALDTVKTIADGIAVKEPGDLTYKLCTDYVDDIVTVTDDEISAAILHLMEKQKLVTEGAGASSAAAVMFNKVPVEGQNVVCILSGGNIDVNILSRVISRGLIMSGRSQRMTLELVDKPGQLEKVAAVIARLGGNVTSVTYENSEEGSEVNGCYLHINMETRNKDHAHDIFEALKQAGFQIVAHS